MEKHLQQHTIGLVVIVVALVHIVWPALIVELNSRRAFFFQLSAFGVRLLGVCLLLVGVLAVLA